jgi:hypothetical protein
VQLAGIVLMLVAGQDRGIGHLAVAR